jgi:hypothetical protein
MSPKKKAYVPSDLQKAHDKLVDENETLKKELAALKVTEKTVRGNAEAAALLLDLKSKELEGLEKVIGPLRGLRTSILTPLVDVATERLRQDTKWGEQNHPDGTGGTGYKEMADQARDICDKAFKAGTGTYKHILAEEVAEAFAESDEENLMTELIQVAAVATSWVENIRRRIAKRLNGKEEQGQNQTH